MMYQVTRQGNTTLFLILVLLLLVASSSWLFGSVWTFILCAVGVLSYCSTSSFCYRPEAREWRNALSEWYEMLFVWSLGYYHRPLTPLQRTGKNGDPQQDHTPSISTEFGSGVRLSDVRSPQPQAMEQQTEEDCEKIEPMKGCHKETQKMIQLIMKDFILTWYANVTSDTEFPEDVEKILEHIALEVNVRLQKVDYQEAVVELLEVILPYLEVLNEAGIRSYSGVELFDVTTEMCVKQFEVNPKVAHYAMKSPQHEKRHYRQALDALIQCAFPPEYAKCDVACTLVREVLIANIIEPLFDLLCDPAFLYEAIPLILAKATPEKIRRQLEDIRQENEELDRVLSRGRLIVNIMGSQGRNKRRFCTTSGRFGCSAHHSSPDLVSGRVGGRGMSRPQSIAVFPHMQRTSSGVYESSSWLTQSSRNHPRHDTIEEGAAEATYPPPKTLPKKFSSANSLSRYGSRALTSGGGRFSYRQHNSVTEGTDFPEEGLEENPDPEDPDPEDHDPYGSGFDGDYAVVELSPIFIERHVRVEDPSAGKTYVAYIFKFPKWMLKDCDLRELGVLESDTHLEGIKRYSEFSRFHNSLLVSQLSLYAKGLNLPEKRSFSNILSKLPFTSSEPDTTVIIERKQGLEKYLQSVSSVEAIISSDLFCQFLKSAVKDLKEANVVNPTRSKKQHRMSFLGRVKGEDSQKAEPIPKRPLESVLSSYLNTHLPLPCQLNSINSIRKNPAFPSADTHQPPSVPSSPTTTAAEPKKPVHKNSPRTSASSMQKQGSMYSLSSAGSTANSSVGSMRRNHSFHCETDSPQPLEHTSAAVPDRSVEHGHLAMEAVYDTTSINGAESAVSSHSSRLFSGEEEEEGCTTGSVTNSISTHDHSLPQARKVSVPRAASTSAPTCNEHHQLVQSQVASHTDTPQVHPDNTTVMLSRFQSLLYRFLVYMHRFITWVVFVLQKGLEPFSKESTFALIAVERQRSPLTNALFSLGSEASARPCPRLWACAQNTQLSLLALAGGGVERFLWRELKLVVCDEVNWTRALYSLRHTLWPGGVFIKSNKSKPSEAELEQLKRRAADAFKKFLPNFLPAVVGPADYDRAIVHCMDCVRNPRLNRHFLLRIVDLLVVKIIPELTNKDFQKHLSQLRTIRPSRSTNAHL